MTIKQKKMVKHNNGITKTISELIVLPESNGFIDKLDTKKKNFVILYTKLNGNISNTCIGIGISRETYYNWLEAEDKTFAMAIAGAESSLNDEIRDILIQQAASGDMTAVIFYLKNRHPDFKPQPNVLIQNNFGEYAKNQRKEYE